jgi:hypothetical protein
VTEPKAATAVRVRGTCHRPVLREDPKIAARNNIRTALHRFSEAPAAFLGSVVHQAPPANAKADDAKHSLRLRVEPVS